MLTIAALILITILGVALIKVIHLIAKLSRLTNELDAQWKSSQKAKLEAARDSYQHIHACRAENGPSGLDTEDLGF
jgi:hypothetical protein